MVRHALLALLLAATVATAARAVTDQPCRVGAQLAMIGGRVAQGSTETKFMRELRAFVERGMGDFVNLGLAGNLSAADRAEIARYLKERGVPFAIHQEPGPAVTPSFPPTYYTDLRDVAGDLFLGVHWLELDSSGLKAETYLPKDILARPTRRAVHDAYVARVKSLITDHRNRYRVPLSHSSATLSHSVFAEAGMDMLCSETGENSPNASMLIASNRGAARAYGLPWLIDHSTWWQPRGHAGVLVSPREGHTPWGMFSMLVQGVMGGADYVQLEVDWAAYDMPKLRDTTADPETLLLPWGTALRNLRALSRAIGPRGDTVTPFGILISTESGWPGVGWRTGDVRGTGLWDGIRHKFMQTRDADLSLKVLDVFYPGFERSGWDPEYPGFLSESPLGTCDLVPDNVSADKWARYKVLVALGYHRMTPAIREELRKYVERGGVLVCSDSLFLDEQERKVGGKLSEPLIGCQPELGDSRLQRVYQGTSSLEEIPGYTGSGPTVPTGFEAVKLVGRDEWQSQWMHPVTLTTGRVVCKINETPYLVENRIGKGRVFYVTATNMVGSDAVRRGQEPFLYANILYYFLHQLNDRLGDGVKFSPWTGINHILNEKADGTGMLLVLNQGDMPYRRDATLRNTRGYRTARVVAQGTWEGYRPGGPVALTTKGESLTWSFEMAPKSLVLFEFRR